jgi:hypothetical protein
MFIEGTEEFPKRGGSAPEEGRISSRKDNNFYSFDTTYS